MGVARRGVKQNGAIFVNTERRFAAMFEQAELRGIPMGPNGPPNAKGTALIASETALLGNRAFLVIWVIWGKIGHFGHFGHPFPRQDGPPERKFHLESGVNQRGEAKSAVPPM